MGILKHVDLAIRQLDEPAAARERAIFARRCAGTAANPPSAASPQARSPQQFKQPVRLALLGPFKPGAGAPASLQPTGSPPANCHRSNTGPTSSRPWPGQVIETELADADAFDRHPVLPVLFVGQEVWLVRRAVDRGCHTTIGVFRRCGRQIGWITPDLAAGLVPHVDGYGLPVPSTIVSLTDGERPFAIRIRFAVPQADVPELQTRIADAG